MLPCRKHRRRQTLASLRLEGEVLEPRVVLDSAGLFTGIDRYWTLSFAEDGTSIGGESSQLVQRLDEHFSRDEWQSTILRAFDTWASKIGTDVGWVGESGVYDFGVDGATSNDPRFGDIRIGARSLTGDVMAISIAHEKAVSGTWAADVIFNSDAQFDALDDLYSVALHEAGHVFGLEHSDDPDSPMHVHGVSSAAVPTLDDVTRLEQIHGIRRPDDWEGSHGNDTPDRASSLEPIELAEEQKGSGPALALAGITEVGDVDYFRVEAIKNYRGPVTVRLVSSGISLLAPRMTIYDADGTIQFEEQSDGPMLDEMRYATTQVDGDAEYLIRVDAPGDGAFSIGDYSLVVTFDNAIATSPSLIDSVARTRIQDIDDDLIRSLLAPDGIQGDDDLGTNDDPEQATELEVSDDFAGNTIFRSVGGLVASDTDFYRIKSPDNGNQVMQVGVRSLTFGGLIPQVRVYDEDQQLLPANILVNGGGQLLVQAGISADKDYFVEIVHRNDPWFDAGKYEMTVSFADEPTELTRFTSGTFDDDVNQYVQQLYVATPQLVHFSLTASAGDPVSSGVLMRILDDAGEVHHQLTARPGETRTAGSVLLTPGSYVFQAIPLSLSGDRDDWIGLHFAVDGIEISDPFALDPEVPSDSEFSCPDMSGTYCFPGDIISTDPFLWVDFLDTLPNIPDLDNATLQTVLLGDWWRWYWEANVANGPPLSMGDSYVTPAGHALVVDASQGVLANDLDPDSATMTAILVDSPIGGTITLFGDGGFSYVPDPGFVGQDSFTYQAYDLQDFSNLTQVDVMVEPSQSVTGDLTGDGIVDVHDIDALGIALRQGPSLTHDLNADGVVDHGDLTFLVMDTLGTSFGDANLDGRFDSGDLVQIFQAGQYEDAIAGNSSWSTGDWNLDGEFDSADLVYAFQSGTYTTALPANAIAALESDRLQSTKSSRRQA